LVPGYDWVKIGSRIVAR
jgi:hypothetical protein